MKSADIKLGATYGKLGLVKQLRQGERLVVRLDPVGHGAQITYRCRGEQKTVFLSNFAKWAEREVSNA